MDGNNQSNDSRQTAHHEVVALVGRTVVLDTAGPILYIGRLRTADASGFWLEEADVHDCREGHASKEQYIVEARLAGVRVNRQRVFVLNAAVISLSALDDIVIE
jgi:hypothetical protein